MTILDLGKSKTAKGTEEILPTVRHHEALIFYRFTAESGHIYTALKHSVDSCRDDVAKQIKGRKK